MLHNALVRKCATTVQYTSCCILELKICKFHKIYLPLTAYVHSLIFKKNPIPDRMNDKLNKNNNLQSNKYLISWFYFIKIAFVCVLNASLMVCIIAEKYITHGNRFIAGYVIFSAMAIEEIILSVNEYVCVSWFC